MVIPSGHSFLQPASQANFDLLLGDEPFVLVRGQLIFRKDGEVMVTQISPELSYTAEEYFQLPEGAPYQLVEGKLVYMAAPHDIHQQISGNLYFFIKARLKQTEQGIVRYAPVDVKLDKSNVYQPDLLFITRERRGILDGFVSGAPDFVVEILSHGSTDKKDRGEKLNAYGKYGVREYWIIDPRAVRLEIYLNHDGELLPEQTITSGEVRSQVIEGLAFDLQALWGE